MALGRHSQVILIIPKLDIVAVMTGVLRDNEFYSVPGLTDDISKAVKSDKPLPPDPIAATLLTNAIHLAATEKPTAISGTPELAKTISGKTYQFADNVLQVKNFTLNFSFGFVVGDHDQHRQGGAAHRPVYRAGRA